MKISINRNVLIAMQGMASRDVTRFILNGIFVEAVGEDVFVVATDGRRMAAIKAGALLEKPAEGQPNSFTFVADTKLIKALCCSGDVTLELSGAETVIRGDGKKSVCVPIIEGTYPKWRQVVPKGTQPEPISPTFNWNLLNSFAKAISIISGNPPTMTVRQGDKLTAMTIFSADVPDFIGILMPLSNYGEFKIPTWATL